MFKKNPSFLNVSELPGQRQYILTKSSLMAWEGVTLSQCLFFLLDQVELEEREQWVPGLDALTGSEAVTLLAAASPLQS